MIEQITLQQRAELLNVNCFSPTVIFSQGVPSNIAKSDSAVIVSATGLSTLDFAFSKTQRPAGGAFLGGGRTADREIVLTIRPNDIYEAKTILNQMMGCQHRTKTNIHVLYSGVWFNGSGYISKIEGALFDKDLDIKITYTMGDPLFYAGADAPFDVFFDPSSENKRYLGKLLKPRTPKDVTYKSPCKISVKFPWGKRSLKDLRKLQIGLLRDDVLPYIEYNVNENYAGSWSDQISDGVTPVYSLNGLDRTVTWDPAILNYSTNGNMVQKAGRSLIFPYVCFGTDALYVRCYFASNANAYFEVEASYVKTRSGF